MPNLNGTNRRKYSEEEITEVIALYESGEPVAEINRTFDLQPTTIYHFLKKRGITVHSKRSIVNSIVRNETTMDLVVTTDKEGWVIGAENKAAHKAPVFVVEFSGFLEISAESLEEALSIARRREIVKRIHSVREKN